MTIDKEKITGIAAAHSGKSRLRRFMKLALASSVLTTGIASAALQDFGPGDALLNFPLWYRDLNNLPLQLCRSTQLSPADGVTPMCFPLPPDPAPAFAGNIGPEAFYMNINANVLTGAVDLRYIAALEAAYATPNPVGAPVLGQETVFGRIRFVMDVLTNDGSCAGDYRIIHPYGDDTFTDVPEGPRGLFVTFDVPIGVPGNFAGALGSGIGPFLQWDDGAGNPLNTTALRAANGLRTANGDEFVGDPSIEHTYTGSPNNTNYVDVQYLGPNPVGTNPGDCNLDGVGGGSFRVFTGALLGQVYTAAIATPTRATKAVYSRTAGGDNIVDVYANSAPSNSLIVTGSGMPNVEMTEDKTIAGGGTGKYHAHLEYNGAVPASVLVSNLTSNPIASSEVGVVDIIEISKSVYDPVSQTLCVNAHSTDQSLDGGAPTIVLEGPHGGALAAADCPASFGAKLDPLDLSYSVVLPNGAPQVTWTTEQIGVSSTFGGRSTADVSTLGGDPDNVGAPLNAGDDEFNNVSDSVASTWNVGANDAAGTTIILSQPASGSVTSGAPGSITYTPAATTVPGDQLITYVVKNGAQVSNIANVTLHVALDTTAAPVTAPDNFAVQRNLGANNTFIVSVLANDKAGKNTTLNQGSIVVSATQAGVFGANAVVPGVAGGTVTAGVGAVTFAPTLNAAAGASSFWYKVASSGGVLSAATRVDVSVAPGAENVTISRNRIQNGAWAIRLADTGAGWSGGALTPTMSCYLVRRNNVNLTPALFIGSAAIPAGGATIDVIATAGTVSSLGTTVPNVPTGQTYTIQCASSNHVAVYPSLTNTANTPTNATTAN